ncbi:DUF1350 family protein [Picosynechococcus sp. NKBG15041c]|uniref:DUF1350 family protein n=1 Tax=Picosynechococcus sp. NKBG15041c TaxID=1407650 RepID=UPI00041D5AC4|nr:DUF1350 family protein [Picosynechococcus sp. NKBG15041c]
MIKPKFYPISFSWVAFHPKPRGIIQFIGGAFFGTFPTIFYHHFLQEIYQAGYSIIALPFRFSLRHWNVANSLLDEQNRLQCSLPKIAENMEYDPEIYRKSANYHWIGHSLGCKYIALLELMTNINDVRNSSYSKIPFNLDYDGIFNQSSILISPDISDLDSAIPLGPLVTLLNKLNVTVQPDRKTTLNLIRDSRLFQLTGMISFDKDDIAGSIKDQNPDVSDVLWLYNYLQKKSHQVTELPGKHLEPLGWKIGSYIVDFNIFDKFIKPLKQWKLSGTVDSFLQEFKQKLKN